MNILKAFLLTAFLLALEAVISLGIHDLTEPKLMNDISKDFLIHYFALSTTISKIIAFLIIFTTIKFKLNWKNVPKKINNLEINLVFYLIIISIGLEFFDRPFFDFTKIVGSYKNNVNVPYGQHELLKIPLIYKGISVLIVAPIFEELFFRKYMLTELLQKYSLKLSVIISSICFSLIHLPSYRNLIPSFIFGIISGIIFMKTKNILYSIILHFLVNFIWFVSLIYGESFYNWIYGLEYNFMYWSLFVFGFLLTLFGIKKITATNIEPVNFN
jgi:membrane protease YdiL (CAAX protease family)